MWRKSHLLKRSLARVSFHPSRFSREITTRETIQPSATWLAKNLHPEPIPTPRKPPRPRLFRTPTKVSHHELMQVVGRMSKRVKARNPSIAKISRSEERRVGKECR